MDKFRRLVLIAFLAGGSPAVAQGMWPGIWLWQSAEQVPCSMAYREGVLAANLALAQQWAVMTQLQATMQHKVQQELNDPAAIARNIGDAKFELAVAGLEVAQQRLQDREQELAVLRKENEELIQRNKELQNRLDLLENSSTAQTSE